MEEFKALIPWFYWEFSAEHWLMILDQLSKWMGALLGLIWICGGFNK
jgi:hypothetical protein